MESSRGRGRMVTLNGIAGLTSAIRYCIFGGRLGEGRTISPLFCFLVVISGFERERTSGFPVVGNYVQHLTRHQRTIRSRRINRDNLTSLDSCCRVQPTTRMPDDNNHTALVGSNGKLIRNTP